MNQKLASISFWKIACVVLPTLLIGVFAYGLTRDASLIPSALIGKLAPEFSLRDLEQGHNIKRSDYSGKILVLNFWASWCGACRTEHSTLVRLSEQFKDDAAVSFLGINYRDKNDKALKFLVRHGAFRYPSLVDAKGRTGIDFGVYGLPETYFVGPDGRIAYRHVGALDEGTALNIIETLREKS